METSSHSVDKRWGESAIDIGQRNFPALKARRIIERLPKTNRPLRVLDYGCGEGKLLRTVRQFYPDAELHGADIRAPLNNRDFTFHLIENCSLALPEHSFDVIFSVDVLEHVEDLDQTLRTISRLLKPGGQFIGFVPTEGERLTLFSVYRLLLGKDLYGKTKDHWVPYRRRQLTEKIRQYFRLRDVSYSYHLIGASFDSTFFALCLIPALSRWWWQSNHYYRPNARKGMLGRLMELVNRLCYWEAQLLRRIPTFSIGLHFDAITET